MGSPSKFLSALLSAYEKTALKNKITAGPAVFEFETAYAVVWETSQKGSGCVKFAKDGKEHIAWDAKSGVIRTDDTVHCVKIPKEAFRSCRYKVFSQGVRFKFGYSALKGKCIENEYTDFNGEEKEDNVNLLVLSDVHDMAHLAKKAVSLFTEKPDIIILLGDIASETEKKKAYVDGVLKLAGEVTKGQIPVVYTRGNHETRGEFASQMIKYFPSDSGEFYFTLNQKAFSAIIIDSGEDKEDGHVEYSGLVDFSGYREQEYAWLCSLEVNEFSGKYKLAFSHDPFIAEHFGKDWTLPLKKLGADILIGGHIHYSHFEGGELPVLSVCGKNGRTGTYGATMINLNNGKISIITVLNTGETILEEEINA